MASVKSIVDQVILKEGLVPMTFVTKLTSIRQIDFSDYTPALIKLGVVKDTVPDTTDLALKGDLINDVPTKEPFCDAVDSTATIQWSLELDVNGQSITAYSISILDVAFSATFEMFASDGSENLQKVSIPSAKEAGFKLVEHHDENIIPIPLIPRVLTISYHRKVIDVGFER